MAGEGQQFEKSLAARDDFPQQERELVTRAWAFAEEAHKGQRRFSGEPYVTHLIETACILLQQGADAPTVAAGLLHDSIEDGGATPDTVRAAFSDEILFLVEGVTKLGKLQYHGLKRHVESLRKLFVAMAEDPRVVLIRLADRLHLDVGLVFSLAHLYYGFLDIVLGVCRAASA